MDESIDKMTSRQQLQKYRKPKNDSEIDTENSKSHKFRTKQSGNTNLKSTGRVKILVINPESAYCKTIWSAIGIGCVHMMIGAVNITVFVYSLYLTDIHASLCCLAYHFFSAEAILGFNHANGWSMPMRQRHRRFVHVFLQLCSMACAIVGTTEVILKRGMSGSFHGVTGTITTALAVLSLLSGPCGLFGKNDWKIIHMSCGIPTFFMSSISLCAGLFTASFKNWADPLTVYLLTGFIMFNSIFIIATCFIKCMMRL